MFIFKKSISLLLLLLAGSIHSQTLDSLLNRQDADTSANSMNMDAVYNRPFLGGGKMPVALGGYLEGNSIYSSTDGISEGLSFQARRLTLFLSATISKRIKFLSEIEFEDGTKEIGIEFAAMDVTFHPMVNFRGGIIMNPIGGFNQNHDGPKWEFIERPDVGVNLLPATWANAGFGFYGKTYQGNWTFGYEMYLSNGFDNSIIDNEHNKTFLPAAKENRNRFEESSNGQPLFTGKIALKNRKIGEIGFSYMGGTYNKFESDGFSLDEKRGIHVFAFDFNSVVKKTGTEIVGEVVLLNIDVPFTYSQQYGSKQQGAFIDIIQPVWKRKILDWENAVFNVSARLDYVDWNVGTFNQYDSEIGDDIIAVTPGVSFRPNARTVFRINYRYHWQTDIINSPSSTTASWLMGISTYF